MSSSMIEHSPLIEIDAECEVRALSFSPDGKYLVSGDKETIRVWQVKEEKWRVAAILEASAILCLAVAVSNDGKWISAGTAWGWLFIWDATTFENVSAYTVDNRYPINGVDFSPDATRLVSASDNHKATVWDRATDNQVQTLEHDGQVTSAKYSPLGDRIATTSQYDTIRVWDSRSGHLLVNIKVSITPWRNPGLLWFGHRLFVASDGEIREFDATTGSALSEWSVPNSDKFSSIALLAHGEIIAHSTDRTVTFWHTSTHSQLGVIQNPQNKLAIACSPDDRLLAVGGSGGRITIQSLSSITDSFPSARQQAIFQEPDSLIGDATPILGSPISPSRQRSTSHDPEIQIDDASLNSWKNDQLADAEASLTTTIDKSENPDHLVLASRALVRAHLQKGDAALVDAEMAIKAQPSVIGYLAKSVAHVRNGERDKAYRACDIAFARFHSSHVTFLLLMKAVVVFMTGDHRDAISRLDDLIATVDYSPMCYLVQAYMYLLLGNSQMDSGDHECAIQSFEHAQSQIRDHLGQSLLVVTLISGWKFEDLSITIQRCLCEALYAGGRIKDAVECFHKTTSELREQKNTRGEHLGWVLDFRQRSIKRLEHLGDTALDSRRYDEAISHYTMALTLSPASPQTILVKRNKAFVVSGSWKPVIDVANQAITLDPSSPWGYEMKYAALHKAGDHNGAVDALEVMLSKIKQSPDPDVQRYGDQYISPSRIRAAILKVVQRTVRHLPRVLINTATGRLHERAEQVSAFETSPIFSELLSSMKGRIDYVRIKREVRQYFRYVMLSHRWEENEPLFHQVIHIAVYDLDHSPTHDKLQTFCEIIRNAGFQWGWSDTCCINKSDHFVLQEALVAMFKWFRGSALTIVFLRGVRSSSRRGALVKSIWNTRAWTLQEYVAAKVIHFYTEDWTLYLNLGLPNHKECPEIISEMEQATGVSTQQLMSLRPGLTSIREKLRLASTRQTTLVEDAAYSLLGIFSVAGISAIYGEGEASLGRLLAHVLAGSGEVSILAWTGESGSYNSCLPAHITVYQEPATSHLPPPIPDAEMERITTSLHTRFDLDVALKLYDHLSELSPPWFAASRMKLPCISFRLPTFTPCRSRFGRAYRANTAAFGIVEIKTRYDLSRMNHLYLVHPWLDTLLEREQMHGGAFVEDDVAPPPSPTSEVGAIPDQDMDGDSLSLAEPGSSSQPAPTHVAPMDGEMRARRLVARLRQPFGAILLTLVSTGRRAADYRRVATDCKITVRFQENVPLADILYNVRTLEVL